MSRSFDTGASQSSATSTSSSPSSGVWHHFGSYVNLPANAKLKSTVGGFAADLSNYITHSVGQIAQQSSEAFKAATATSRRRCVLYKSFAEWYLESPSHTSVSGEGTGMAMAMAGDGQRRYRFLLVGLVDGFQILEMTSTKSIRLIAAYTDGPTPMMMTSSSSSSSSSMTPSEESNLLNQSSTAATPIGMLKMITHHTMVGEHHQTNQTNTTAAAASSLPSLPSPNQSSSHHHPHVTGTFYGSLLAVCSGDDRPHFPRSLVKIFSLSLHRYVHLIRFKSKIFGIHVHPSSKVMVIVLENEVFVYTLPTDGYSLTFECLWSTRILPNPSSHILSALQCSLASNPTTASLLATSTFSKDETSVVALSHRWIASCAYELPTNEPAAIFRHALPNAFDATTPHTLASSGSNESLSTVAKGIASGLYNLGGMGKLAVANYLAGDNTNNHSNHNTNTSPSAVEQQQHQHQLHPSHASSSVLGTVIVRDVHTQRLIACIRAHPNTQVTHMVFDRSGTLLATVPVDGQYVHIYQIVMVPEPITNFAGSGSAATIGATVTDHSPHSNAASRRTSVSTHSPVMQPKAAQAAPPPPQPRYHTRFLYRLFRGVTHAVIRDVSFSFDSKYVSVVSSKGTVHVYAIHPYLGGDVNIHTHGGRMSEEQMAPDENSNIQQMIAKYTILQTQNEAYGGQPIGSTPLAHSSDDSDLHSALDSFLYQPKVLSAIWRIKPDGAPTSWPIGGSTFHAPHYQHVIATFERLQHTPNNNHNANNNNNNNSSTNVGGNANNANQTTIVSAPHHLLIATWNDELNTYSVSTSFSRPSATSSVSHPTIDLERPKLTLNVDPIATFDMHTTLLTNAIGVGVAANTHYPSHSHVDDDDAPTVRILTTAGQEDESSTVGTRNHLRSSSIGASAFFRQIDQEEEEHIHSNNTQHDTTTTTITPNNNNNSNNPHAALPHAAIQRSTLASSSPIFATIQTNAVESTPILGSQQHQQQQPHQHPPQPPPPSHVPSHAHGSRWLSQVELRTFQISDVPLWASPQFSLKCYTDTNMIVPTTQLCVEQFNTKLLPYDKFTQFVGLRTTTTTTIPGSNDPDESPPSSSSSSSNNTSSLFSSIDVTDAITSALSTSMLDDNGFIASIRASSASTSPAYLRQGVDAIPNDSTTFIDEYDDGDDGDGDAIDGVQQSSSPTILNLTGQLDESYYPSVNTNATTTTTTDKGENGPDTLTHHQQPSSSPPSFLSSHPSMVGSSSVSFPSLNATASEILFAPLPPPPSNREEESLLLSPAASNSTSPPNSHQHHHHHPSSVSPPIPVGVESTMMATTTTTTTMKPKKKPNKKTKNSKHTDLDEEFAFDDF